MELCDGRGSLVLARVSGASKKAVTVEAIADARQVSPIKLALQVQDQMH